MFLGIINALLSLGNTFLYKKAIDSCLKDGFSAVFRTFVMNITTFLILVVPVIFFFRELGIVRAWEILNITDVGFFCGVSILSIIGSFAGQYAYANEKISTLAPFGQVSGVATIMLGFLFFSGNSTVAFVAAIVASIAMIAGSIDFKSFTFNRYSGALLVGGIFGAFSNLIVVALITRYSSFTLIVSRTVIELLIAMGISLLMKDFIFPTRKHIAGSYRWFFLDNIVWLTTYAIGLFLIKDLGIVFASLLGMLWLIATVGLAWVLGERPSRKDFIVAGIVSVCVLIAGVYG